MTTQTNANPRPSSAILIATVAVVVAFPVIIGLQTLFHRDKAEAVPRPAKTAAPKESYGWVDRERGVVRIPVQRAMEFIVQESTDEVTPK